MPRKMNGPDLRQRLDVLIAAIGPPAVRRAPGGETATAGADAHTLADAQIDDLVRRVAALTRVLGADGREWDEVDQLAAQLLLADLAAVTSTLRALNDLASARLSDALADLRAASMDIQGTLKETAYP